LRLGARPQLMVTTTPRPIRALRELVARPDTVLTQASTWENRRHLAPGFLAALAQRWRNTAQQRQELLGDLIEDEQGMLWRRADLEAVRGRAGGPLERIVVAVDPPASAGPQADACGIIAAGRWDEGRRAVVLADASVRGLTPQDWAMRAAVLARTLNANAIVAECNNGGEIVRAVLKAAAPELPVKLVRASEGKRARAEPIAALYAQGRVLHAAAFPALEEEMCAFGGGDFRGGPDRMDALVWALSELMLTGASAPRMRVI